MLPVEWREMERYTFRRIHAEGRWERGGQLFDAVAQPFIAHSCRICRRQISSDTRTSHRDHHTLTSTRRTLLVVSRGRSARLALISPPQSMCQTCLGMAHLPLQALIESPHNSSKSRQSLQPHLPTFSPPFRPDPWVTAKRRVSVT